MQREKEIYTQVNRDHQCIFVHIPKTAGVSIKEVLSPGRKSGIAHKTLLEYYRADQDLFDRYFKFAICRNPWDRFVSSYFFLLAGGRNPADRDWSARHLKPDEGIGNFITRCGSSTELRRALLGYPHFRPQHEYICIDNRIAVDYLGRFENLAQAYQDISEKLGLQVPLSHQNRSEHLHYATYYDADSRQVIADIYARDIELFGYRFAGRPSGTQDTLQA